MAADGGKRFLDIAALENLSQFQLYEARVYLLVDPDEKYNVGSGNMGCWEIKWRDILITLLGIVLDVRLHKLLCSEVSVRRG